MCLFVLLDSRHKPQKIDLEFMQWLGEKGIPFVMCFTKQDKLSKTESAKNLAHYKKEMLQIWDKLPPLFLTSSAKKTGQEEVLQFIEDTNKLY
jgi:GTP-binding protein